MKSEWGKFFKKSFHAVTHKKSGKLTWAIDIDWLGLVFLLLLRLKRLFKENFEFFGISHSNEAVVSTQKAIPDNLISNSNNFLMQSVRALPTTKLAYNKTPSGCLLFHWHCMSFWFIVVVDVA